MDKLIRSVNIEVKESDDASRTITAIGSKEIVDRDYDVVKLDGMSLKEYKKNPVVLWSHDHRDLPIGKAVGKMAWVDGNELKFKIQFASAEENPKAEYIYRLYKGGFLKSFSVGFSPDYSDVEYKEDKKTGRQVRYINKSELFEISAVNVPANTAAVIQAFEKSWDAGVIDGEELLELQKLMPENKESDPEPVNKDKKIEELEQKVLELEMRLELKEEDDEPSIYDELFNEFNYKRDEVDVDELSIDDIL